MPLPTMYYQDGYEKWLKEDYLIKLPFSPDEDIITDWISFFKNGILLLKKGYAWDGASGPTIDTKNTVIASAVHDALYQLMRDDYLSREQYRDKADALLIEHCMEATPSWRKPIEWARFQYWYAGVRVFAGQAALKGSNKPVKTAP